MPGLVILLVATVASAQTLGAVTKSGVKRARTLGDIAGWIVLNNPTGSQNEKIVISDNNLRETARLGVISEGSGAWNPSEEEEERQREARDAASRAWKDRLDEQRHEVEQLQQRMQRIESQRAANQDAFPGQSSPHNRIGGTQSRAQLQRQETARELEQARNRLRRSSRAARREGHRLD